MKLFRNKKQAQAPDFGERGRSLAAVPHKNPGIKATRREDGGLRLSYEVKLKPWFAKYGAFLGGPKDGMLQEKKLDLDLMGARVWSLIDGQKPVSDLIDDFVEKYKLHPKEAEAAMTQFLRDLGKKGLVILAAGDEPGGD